MAKNYELPDVEAKKGQARIVQHKAYLIPVVAITGLTIVLTVVALVVGFVINSNIERNKTNNSIDKFTYCLQTVMSESQKIGKAVEVEKAGAICSGLQKE